MNHLKYLFCSLFLILCLTQCVDSELDSPPLNGVDPNISADQIISLSEVLDMWVPGVNIEIGLDKYIEGIVAADDQTGNFYKTLIIQEGNQGISIVIDETDLFNTYPTGRKVFVHLEDLWISDFNFNPQLGMAPSDGELSRIPTTLLSDIVLPGTIFNELAVNEISLSQLSEQYLNTLVKLSDVEFANEALNQTFAVSTATENFSVNHPLQDCNGNTLDFRTSGFATFANDEVPFENGTVYGVLGRFGITGWQIMARDLGDLDMTAERCDGSGGGGGTGTEGQISIEELQNMWNSGSTIIGDNYIEGVVISDYENGNINNQNLQIQEGEFGITIRFDEPHSFPMGEKLKIDLAGREISEFNGQVQVADLFISRAESLGAGTLPEPRVATVEEVLANHDLWESTLVKLEGITASGGSVWEDVSTLTDATGSIGTFISFNSTFGGDGVPSGSFDMVGIVSEFNNAQVLPRNEEDIQ